MHIAKKTFILYILKMLKQGSSSDRPISFTNMTKVLNSMGISCTRKTVGRNVDYLIEFGYPITRLARGRCYYEQTKKITKGDFDMLVKIARRHENEFSDKCFIENFKLLEQEFTLYTK